MKLVTFVVVLALVATVSAEFTFKDFEQWAHNHGKIYENEDAMMSAFEKVQATAERVALRNHEHSTLHGLGRTPFGLNKFSDLTPEEFKAQYLKFEPSSADRSAIEVHNSGAVSAPSKYDWRHHGAVTAVKDQGQCGSCWAFSATEETESMNAVKGTIGLQKLSVQQVVSCDQVDGGCNGGDTITAYQYIQKAGGLTSEAKYPYTSGEGDTGFCSWNGGDIVASISSYKYATPGCQDSCDNQDETTLKNNLASTGPVSICVNAEPWQDYSGGVMSSGCSHGYYDLDHCVQLVGYNAEQGNGYWLVRNSWNTNWGEEGYIYLEMGSNVCGVADEATFVFP